MKKSYLSVLVLCFLGIMLGKNEFKMVSDSEISFQLPEYSVSETNIDGTDYSVIKTAKRVSLNKKGYAELPYYAVSLELENSGKFSYEIIDSEYKIIDLKNPLLPSRGTIYRNQDPKSIPYKIADDAVKDEWYPLTNLDKSEEFIIRNKRGQSILVYPFQYNAVKKQLKVYTSLRITQKKTSFFGENELKRVATNFNIAERGLYDAIFLNSKSLKADANLTMNEEGDLHIIYTSALGGLAALTEFIEWKKARGFNVTTEEVAVGTNVKATIQAAYNANPDIMYVQLVGDWAQIKSDIGSSGSAPMDPMLGCVVGTDNYADIVIGRFSAETESELAVQLNKAINYEKNPDTAGDWYSKGIGIGSDEGAGDDNEYDYAHMDVIKEDKLMPYNYTEVAELYQTVTSSQISAKVNEGASIINYIGHGASDGIGWNSVSGFYIYRNNDVNTLSNGSKLPIFISVACVNGEFHKSADCFAETWLRKENGGAVATLMSTINQPWQPPMRGQDYMNDILTGGYNYDSHAGQNGLNTTELRTTFGSITFNGLALMYNESGSPSSGENLDTYQTWTLFGDATLQVRNETPKEIATGGISIISGLDWEGTLTSGGSPVKNASVVLEQNGSYYKTTTNSSGQFTLEHEALTGNAKLYITGYNLLTIAQDVVVGSPDGPYLMLNDYYVGTSGVKEINYNSTNDLSIVLKNTGNDPSNQITGLLTTESNHVIITTNNIALNELVSEGSETFLNAFEIEVNREVANGTSVPFALTLTDNYSKAEYVSEFNLTVNAPELVFGRFTQEEVPFPGESGTITIDLENTGNADLDRGTLKLSTGSVYDITIVNPEITLDGLSGSSKESFNYTVHFPADLPLGSFIPFKAEIVGAEDFSQEAFEFNYLIGISDGFETGDLSTMDWVTSGDANWACDNNVSSTGNYSVKSGEINDDEESILSLTKAFAEAGGKVSFMRKVSCEKATSSFWDGLQFFVDGTKIIEWSGELDWEYYEYNNIPEGEHTFTWKFVKDGYLTEGEDCAWLDNIVINTGETSSFSTEDLQPLRTELNQNYPNPFNPSTTISFTVENNNKVSLSVYNSNGQLVKNLVNKNLNKGKYSVPFDADDLNSGVYYYRMKAGNKILTKKMILVK